MELRDSLRILQRRWAGILCVLALFLIAGAAYTVLQKPRFEASTQAVVTLQTSDEANDRAQAAQFVQTQVKTIAGLATQSIVLDRVRSELRLSTSEGALAQQVTAEAPVDTSLIKVTADASTPKAAADIANSVTSNLAYVVRAVNGGATTSGVVVLTPTDPATAPASPASPNALLNLGVAAILGLLVGVGVGVLRERLDTRIRNAEDAREVVAVPLLGQIFDDPKASSRPLLAAAGDDSRRSEAFRTLRTNLEFLDYDQGAHSIVVTSSLPREGKSLLVANLAVVLAEAGRRVVVVDADLRRPRVGEYFGLEDRTGLTDVLIGAAPLDRTLQEWGTSGLRVLPAGRVPPNPSELLQSEAMHHLISGLEDRFDVVLIDSPPLLPVSDAAILTKRASGAILVAAAEQTRSPELRRAAESLQQVDGKVLGLVLTRVPLRRSSVYGYESLPARGSKPQGRGGRSEPGTDPAFGA